jgi:roadblock/LC7 domain-containing protein
MPYFRAQMNVPGMVTEFAFEPFIQLLEYRTAMVKKVANINAIVLKVLVLLRKVRLH